MKAFLVTILIILGVVILTILGSVMRVGRLAREQAHQLVEKTFDADNIILNYEWFKNQYREILSIEVKIKNADKELANFKESAGQYKELDFQGKAEYSRLTANLTGAIAVRADMVAQYNARTNMVNRQVFMDHKDVPNYISPDFAP